MMLDQSTRVTPKFRESENFNNILSFLLTCDTASVDLILDMSNMDSEYSVVLDEIGKLLGVYPRPVLPTVLTGGGSTIFALDESLLDTVPFADESALEIRPLTNAEYSQFLKAIATGSDFSGFVNEWEEVIFQAIGANAIFINNPSSFDVIIKRDLTDIEKGIMELIQRYNILTVNISFLGTVDETTTPWALDSTPLDVAGFAKPW